MANCRALLYGNDDLPPTAFCVAVTRSSSNGGLVNKADHFREAEIALGTESREQAEAELKNVGAERLAASAHRIHRMACVFLLAPPLR